MPRESAGLLCYRRRAGRIEVLLAHLGGPFWARKDVWMIPKGEFSAPEDPLAAARREFREELGSSPEGPFVPLPSIRQSGGKLVHAWAFEGDFDPAALVSTEVAIEWPPRSGRSILVPEVDRVAWFDVETARDRILPSQRPLLDALEAETARRRPD